MERKTSKVIIVNLSFEKEKCQTHAVKNLLTYSMSEHLSTMREWYNIKSFPHSLLWGSGIT